MNPRIAAPRNPRELFLLLARLEAGGEDLAGLLGRVDFSGVTPAQVYHSALGRAPERLAQAWADRYDARAHLAAALASPEFRARSVELFLNAFPGKRRLLFIHVPKCAGTDLRVKLLPKFPALSHVLASKEWIADNELFAALGATARAVGAAEELLVYGHIQLSWYLARMGTRLHDRIFTVIRDPVDLVISQANYAVTMLVNDPTGLRPDARANLARLGLERLPENPAPGMLKDLALRALHDPRMTTPNLICGYLGAIGKGCAEAIRNIVTRDVEVTDTARYDDWAKEAWGIEAKTRHNRSMTFLSRGDLEPYRAHLDRLTGEDQKVFDLISWALAQTGRPSVRGSEVLPLIARGNGPYRLDAERDEIVRVADALRPAAPETNAALAAGGPRRAGAATV